MRKGESRERFFPLIPLDYLVRKYKYPLAVTVIGIILGLWLKESCAGP